MGEKQTLRRYARWLAMFAVPILIAAAGYSYWQSQQRYVGTDNAYVRQDKVSVASDVAGRIVEVAVHDNQPVKAGDLLFRVDPEPYRIALQQADAAIADAEVNVGTLQSGYAASIPDIAAAEDALKLARENLRRQNELMARGFTTRTAQENAEHAVTQAQIAINAARADAANAKAKLATGAAAPGQNPAVARARAAREQAALSLARTEVRAPADGIVSQVDRLQVGQMAIAGLPVLTIVGDGNSWVEANFKETDLDRIRVGQPVELEFDAYPGLTLKGRVASIGAGTGNEFAIIPAQNATGNWVKVTQRVPVRIALPAKTPRKMIAGLAVEVKIDVGDDGR